jgi:hypothetical protein
MNRPETTMSTRDRWIVYPLLFLALGTAIKPKLVPAERVTCRTLEVVDDDLRTRIRMTAATASDDGEIRIANQLGKSVVVLRADSATQAGLVETLNGNGQVQTIMSSAGGGDGQIKVNNRRGRPVVMLRADAATRAGLIETLSDEGKLQTAMMSSATGGEIAALDHDSRNTVVIGHRDGRFGLIQTDLGSGTFAFVPISKLAVLSKLVP